MEITWNDVRSLADRYLMPFVVDLIVAIAVFYFGRILARILARAASRVMERSDMDVSLRKFLTDLLYAVMLVAVIVAALDSLGIETTALVAVLGGAALAIGLALQGSLANFAAGVMIIVLRPYRIGDHVVIGKYVGRVEAIKVFHTILITADHREVVIPNGKIISDPIENTTVLGTRRVEIQISVAHGTNLHEVRQWLEGIVLADRRVLATPPPSVDLTEVSSDGVKLFLRPWADVGDYTSVAADTIERVKETLESHEVKFQVVLQSGV